MGRFEMWLACSFTIVTAIIMPATFISKGSIAFNPKDLYGERLNTGLEEAGDCESAGEENEGKLKKEVGLEMGGKEKRDTVGVEEAGSEKESVRGKW